MAVVTDDFLGGYTPVCNDCGVHLCWGISTYEYEEEKRFWDSWICQDCNGGVKFSKAYYEANKSSLAGE